MNKRQAKQTAHAIVAELILRARMDDMLEFTCEKAPLCGNCGRCRDHARVHAQLLEIQEVHQGLGHNHFDPEDQAR